jgi:hypothetical protein
MAGSPMRGNLNLDKKNLSERNQNTGAPRIRKQGEQPSVGAQKDSEDAKAITAKTRKAEQTKTKTKRQKG